ncbi:MAG TPA: MauE/DoxX family redox-associated membrane protein [Streptosporangiaceae bacterium]|nr:MauE/DoxX family redox-associated membrane protein [Streptosporangiaceae bacterium]
MFTALREAQIPVLAVMLLGGCAAKAWRALHSRSAAAGMDATGPVPLHLRRPAVVMLFMAEALLGLGLIGTAGRLGDAVPHLAATIVRTATALFFLIAVGALNELRQRRPDAGCGCFGELSDTPVGLRTIARSGVLCASAVATIGLPPLRMPSSSTEAEMWLAVLAVELLLIAFLSPELGDILVRLGYTEPCELRRIPVGRTISVLRASSPWRRYASQVSTAEPADVWREGCWRFLVYPGIVSGRRVDIVFAVYLQTRRPAIRVAVLDAATDEILGLAGARKSAAL